MSFAALNNCILFANSPYWKKPVDLDSAWRSGVAQISDGNERRAGFTDTPLRKIRYGIFPSTPAAQMRAAARLLAALETGKIAVPIWGRGDALGSAYSHGDATLTLSDKQWPWVIGDYFIIPSHGLDDEDFIAGTVTGVSGNTLTVSTSYSGFSFDVNELIYPVLFGRPEITDFDSKTIFHVPATLTVSEPLPTGSLGISSSNSEPSYNPITTERVCDQVPVLSITSSCGVSDQLSWTSVFGAELYRVYRSDSPGGPYSLIATQATRTYAAGKPYLENKYWVVTAIIGGIESNKSNEVVSNGSFIEKSMRAMQERFYTALGYYIDWPDHALSSTDPGNYPADGFYDSDIASGGAAREVELIQSIADQFTHALLNKYARSSVFENANPDYPINYYSNGVSTFYGPFTALPLTVTEANREASFNAINELMCYLEILIGAPTWSSRYIKVGADTGPTATAEEAIANARAAYNAYPITAASANPNMSAGCFNDPTPLIDPYWTADFRAVSGTRECVLDRYGRASVKHYMAMDVTIGLSRGYINGYNDPPVEDDGLLHLYEEVELYTGGTIQTLIAGTKLDDPPHGATIGWEWDSDVWVVIKLSESELGFWNHYP